MGDKKKQRNRGAGDIRCQVEEVMFFVPSSIGSCCFLLLVACLLGVSLVSLVCCITIFALQF